MGCAASSPPEPQQSPRVATPPVEAQVTGKTSTTRPFDDDGFLGPSTDKRTAPPGAKPLSDTPALEPEEDAKLRAIRADHAGAATPLLCLSFAGGSVDVMTTSVSFLAGTHYPGKLTLVGRGETVGWINSVPYHDKDKPLETRACLTDPYEWWLPAKYGLDAASRTIELHYFVEGATEPSATVLCKPNAAYAGGLPGLRLRTLIKPCFSGTLIAWREDGLCDVREDNGETTAVEMTPSEVETLPDMPRHPTGQRLLALHAGRLVDAELMGYTEAGRSRLAVGRVGVEVDLNRFNHCMQRFGSVAEYVAAAEDFCMHVIGEVGVIILHTEHSPSHPICIRYPISIPPSLSPPPPPSASCVH